MPEPSFAIAVAFQTVPEHSADFLKRVTQQAKDSIEKEPDCHQFDVLVDTADCTIIFLYETYTDEAAFDAHCQTPHFADFSSTVEPWVISKDLRKLVLQR
jgi:autoinducer 2-degrading protein